MKAKLPEQEVSEKLSRPKPVQVRVGYHLGGGILIVAIGIVIVFGMAKYNSSQKSNVALAPTSYPTESVTATPSFIATPSPNLTPAASPSPSVTPNAFPATAQSVLDAFYAAYKNKDIETLSISFTADTTSELKSLHARLFTGIDISGNPGGPTLFSTNSAAQYVTSHTVQTTQQAGNGWKITVQEQRVTGAGQTAKTVQTVIVLVLDQKSNWLIDSYSYVGSTDKYGGFLI